MRYLKTIWVLALALLWVPITSHCQLEVLPLFAEALGCCDHEEKQAPHQDNDCEQDVCASVESGDYRTQEHDPLFVAPDFVAAEIVTPGIELGSLPNEISLGIFATAPPDQQHIWQFAFRAALPIRAPSSAS